MTEPEPEPYWFCDVCDRPDCSGYHPEERERRS